MTVEEKIQELNRRMGPVDNSMMVNSLEEIKARPKRKISIEELDKSAAKIRKSVIRYSRALESQS